MVRVCFALSLTEYFLFNFRSIVLLIGCLLFHVFAGELLLYGANFDVILISFPPDESVAPPCLSSVLSRPSLRTMNTASPKVSCLVFLLTEFKDARFSFYFKSILAIFILIFLWPLKIYLLFLLSCIVYGRGFSIGLPFESKLQSNDLRWDCLFTAKSIKLVF